MTPIDADPASAPTMISIIIATYNARDLLANCLGSIERNRPHVSYEVVVVDDASVDDTAEMVRARFPAVRLLRNEVNQHYAFSNNRALACARGQYILLLNNDTIVLPEAIDRMVAFLREHPDVGAVGCKLLNEDGSVQWSVKSVPNLGSALFGARSIITRLFPDNYFARRHLLHLTSDMKTPFAAGYVSGAAVMHPRHVMDKVGGLDVRLSYHVDADYCKRIADIGYRSCYLPAAAIIHLDHRGGTMVSLRRRFRSIVEFHVGSYIYYRKHGTRSAWRPMHIIVVLGLSARFLLSVLAQACSELAGIARTSLRRHYGVVQAGGDGGSRK
jgi:GT2 family glycosyltransferase